MWRCAFPLDLACELHSLSQTQVNLSPQSAFSLIVNQHKHRHRCEESAFSKVDQTNSKSNCSVQHMQLSVNVKVCAAQHVWSVYRTTALMLSVPHYRPYALCTSLPPLRSHSAPHYRPYALCTSLPPSTLMCLSVAH